MILVANSRKNPCIDCVTTLIEARSAQCPEAIALWTEQQTLTYRQLNAQANQLAHYLKSQGVTPETLVGVCLERTPMMVVALLAILKAGGAYVPLDPGYPRERLALMLEDSGLTWVVTETTYRGELPSSQHIRSIYLDLDWGTIAQANEQNLAEQPSPSDLAYIIYTSGSTGRPKGVMIEHHSLSNLVYSLGDSYELTPKDRVLQFASISFDVAVEEIFVTLSRGACLVLRSKTMLSSITGFIKACQDWELTVLNLPTALWHQICGELTKLLLPEQLRLLIIGSDRALPHWLEQWKELAPPQIRLVNAYGPTEATVTATLCDLAGPQAINLHLNPAPPSRVLPIGHAIDNVRAWVMNEALQPVAPEQEGELLISGMGLARGYLNRPEMTQERFICQTLDGEAVRLYRTGDRVRSRPDGLLEFLDRKDNQVKIRGFRIELQEIDCLLNQHPQIKQAIVIAREDNPGDKRLVAYLVLHERSPENSNKAKAALSSLNNLAFVSKIQACLESSLIAQIRSYLSDKLPSYMVPVAFMTLPDFPLTPNGKVDRRALPKPSCDRPLLEQEFIAPRTELEQQLSLIWGKILSLKAVGIQDNFFELGGDSLRITQLIAKTETACHITVPLADFLRNPTILGLANLIHHLRHTSGSSSSEKMSLHQLQAQVLLDPCIQSTRTVKPAVTAPLTVFMTGGTGFLGAFILSALLEQTQAQIYCLVRGHNEHQARHKLITAGKKYGIDFAGIGERIIPIVGDIGQPCLGLTDAQFQTLATSVDAIYHSAANVNLLYPYESLYGSNVQGTHEILKLTSQGKVKVLHYLSTLDVFESLAETGVHEFYEQDSIAQGAGLSSGYAQSKWVAEQMVRAAGERGLSTCIFRPGMVTGHSQSGHSNTSDAFCRLIKSLTELRTAPRTNLLIDMVPVDYISQALVKLSLQPSSLGQTFHLVNPQPLALNDIVQKLNSRGYEIKFEPYPQWQKRLKSQSNALSSLALLMDDNPDIETEQTCLQRWLGGNDRFDCSNSLTGLQGSNLTCLDSKVLIERYLSHLADSHFLSQPLCETERTQHSSSNLSLA